MCDDDAGGLVMDNGSGMCKAGFAGIKFINLTLSRIYIIIDVTEFIRY